MVVAAIVSFSIDASRLPLPMSGVDPHSQP
jgi:hypothetical protein